MKNLRRINLAMLALCITLSGCGGNKSNNESKDTPRVTDTTDHQDGQLDLKDEKNTLEEKTTDGNEVLKEEKVKNEINDGSDKAVKEIENVILENYTISNAMIKACNEHDEQAIKTIQSYFGYNDHQLSKFMKMLDRDFTLVYDLMPGIDQFTILKVIDLELNQKKILNDGTEEIQTIQADGEIHNVTIQVPEAKDGADIKALQFDGTNWKTVITVVRDGCIKVDLNAFTPLVVISYTYPKQTQTVVQPVLPKESHKDEKPVEVKHPKINKITLNQLSHTEGRPTRIKVGVETEDIKSNTPVVIQFLDEVKNVLIKQEVSLNNNEAKMYFDLDDTYASGKYMIRVEVDGKVKEIEYEIDPKPLLPEFDEIQIDSTSQVEGETNQTILTGTTSNVADHTPIKVEILDESKQPLVTPLKEKTEVMNNTFNIPMAFAANLPQGCYFICLTMNQQTRMISYTVQPKKEPTITNLTLDHNEAVYGENKPLNISIDTENIEDEQEVIVKLMNDNKEYLNVPTKILNNHAEVTMQIDDSILEGSYDVVVNVSGIEKKAKYTLSHKYVPSVLDLSYSTLNSIEGEETTVKVHFEGKDIQDGSELEIILKDGETDITSVKQEVHQNNAVLNLVIPNTLEPKTYQLVATINGLVETHEYHVERKLVPTIQEVTLDKNSMIALMSGTINLMIKTYDVLDGTQITCELIHEDGTSLDEMITNKSVIQENNTNLKLDLNNKLEEGNYLIKVCIPSLNLEKTVPFSLLHKMQPTIKELELSHKSIYEQELETINVNIQTIDIADEEILKVEVVDSNGNAILPNGDIESSVLGNNANTEIPVKDLKEGNYYIKVTYHDLVNQVPFTVLEKLKPEILETIADIHIVSYGYEEIMNVALKNQAIDPSIKPTATLLHKDGTVVDGINEFSVRSKEETNEDGYMHYEIIIDPIMDSDDYMIKMDYDNLASTNIDLTVSDCDAGWIGENGLLDYSKRNDQLYWFDELNKAYPYDSENSPFDETKPVMIFIHGWQPGGVKENFASDFNYEVKDKNGVTYKHNNVKSYIDQGYNVGVYNWVQIADEEADKRKWWHIPSYPYSAEAKIWVTNFNLYKKPMRYRFSDQTFEFETEKTAPDLFVEKYIDAMKGYKGDYVQFDGHSLGNQMVLRSSDLLLDKAENGEIDHSIVPDRVTLFDPYYSGNYDLNVNYKEDKNISLSVAATKIANRLANKNISIQMIKSSQLTQMSAAGDINSDLENIVFFSKIEPNIIGLQMTTDTSVQAALHSASYQYYYWENHESMSDFYHKTNAEIASLMGNCFRLNQTEGKDTVDPHDDHGELVVSKSIEYVAPSDVELSLNGEKLEKTALDDHEQITIGVNEYIQVKAFVPNIDASSKVVTFEKVSNDIDSVQLAYDGFIKGTKPGVTTIKAYVNVLNANGEFDHTIERYFDVNVQ